MAFLNTTATAPKSRMLRHSLLVDMTPLVDLGFLLITFFVFTSTLSSSATTSLVVPKDGPPTNTASSNTLSLLAGGANKVYAYSGFWHQSKVKQTSYDVHEGVGAIIRAKKAQLAKAGTDPEELFLIIKPSADASYQNVVDLLDEVMINNVKHYAIVEADAPETAFMAVR
jgi:biopolymer transport protein ExbD